MRSVTRRAEQRRLIQRSVIVKVAKRHFLTLGYSATTMSGIAADVGGSKATLWSHFNCKTDLLVAVTKVVAADLLANIPAAIDGADTTDLEKFCQGFIANITADEPIALQRLLVGVVAPVQIADTNVLLHVMERASETVAAFLICKAPDRIEDCGKAADLVISLCVGTYYHRVLLGLQVASPAGATAEAGELLRILLRYFVTVRLVPPA